MGASEVWARLGTDGGRVNALMGLVLVGVVGIALAPLAAGHAALELPVDRGGGVGYPLRIELSAKRAGAGTAAAITPGSSRVLEPIIAPRPADPSATAAPLAAPAAGPAPSVPRRGGVAELAVADFDLADLDRGAARAVARGEALRVEKTVRAGGADRGKVAVEIAGDARIMVAPRALKPVFEAAGDAAAARALEGLAARGEVVSFDTLRAAGIAVRYDAARDRVVLGED